MKNEVIIDYDRLVSHPERMTKALNDVAAVLEKVKKRELELSDLIESQKKAVNNKLVTLQTEEALLNKTINDLYFQSENRNKQNLTVKWYSDMDRRSSSAYDRRVNDNQFRSQIKTNIEMVENKLSALNKCKSLIQQCTESRTSCNSNLSTTYRNEEKILKEFKAYIESLALVQKNSNVSNHTGSTSCTEDASGDESVSDTPEDNTPLEPLTSNQTEQKTNSRNSPYKNSVKQVHILSACFAAINKNLEIREKVYRNLGLSETEIVSELIKEKWRLQQKCLNELFPGQEVSPHLFNAFEENSSASRMDEIGQYFDSSKADADSMEKTGYYTTVNTQSMIDSYCDTDLSVLSDEKRKLRVEDCVCFQEKEAFENEFYSLSDSSQQMPNGYSIGEKAYVNTYGPHPEKTSIHEFNHVLSSNDVTDRWGNVVEYRHGISIDHKDIQVNEALTEFFTKQMMKDNYPKHPDVLYMENVEILEKMSDGFGIERYKKAYYNNNPQILIDRYEEVMGPGTWERFSKAMDQAIAIDPIKRVLAKRKLNEYLALFIVKSKGDSNS